VTPRVPGDDHSDKSGLVQRDVEPRYRRDGGEMVGAPGGRTSSLPA
jgi:hypothetical protein